MCVSACVLMYASSRTTGPKVAFYTTETNANTVGKTCNDRICVSFPIWTNFGRTFHNNLHIKHMIIVVYTSTIVINVIMLWPDMQRFPRMNLYRRNHLIIEYFQCIFINCNKCWDIQGFELWTFPEEGKFVNL